MGIFYHGTSAELVESIQRDGLLARDGRSVFLVESVERAIFYARARSAAAWELGQDRRGLVVTVDLDAADVEPDPFHVHELGQYRARNSVLPAAIIALETIDFGWGRISWDRASALADHAALERARAKGQDVWRPPTVADVAADVATVKEIGRSTRQEAVGRLAGDSALVISGVPSPLRTAI